MEKINMESVKFDKRFHVHDLSLGAGGFSTQCAMIKPS